MMGSDAPFGIKDTQYSWVDYETQYNNTQHNDTQHNDTHHNGTQHNDTQQNGTQHNGTKNNDTRNNETVHKYPNIHFSAIAFARRLPITALV